VATNKHAVIRYQTLDKCFRNPGRKYFIEDLVEACSQAIYEFSGNDNGIKRRQILDDIKFMESEQGWNIPLERIREGHRIYFKYEDKSFSINNQPLNETEENQLKEALLTLSRFKGMPQFEWVDEISARLDSGLGLSKTNEKIIEFEQNNYLKGLEFITPIYNSILYKKVINIEYKSFKQDITQSIIFHPYFLKQYNNRWFVFGKNDSIMLIQNLALDRINKIEESLKVFLPNESIDFNEYFEDIIGVSVNKESKIENILLKVSNELFPYIQTKPIHGSQKLKENYENYIIVSLDLIPNYEFESLILGYGEGIEVLKPLLLRDKLKKRFELIINNYKKDSADTMHFI
jgi:predicted DNA-binding transcriptional regulator YafY